MNEVEIMMSEVVKKLSMTKEYNQYHNLLSRIKEQPELYHRIGDFRRRSLSLRMSENGNAIHEMNNLQNEFRDLQTNGLASDFLAAEHQYCRMISGLQTMFLDGAEVDTGFLDQ